MQDVERDRVARSSSAPLVSFVIPAYNAEKYLVKVLEALVTHTRDLAHEVIIVDNGSTDDTIAIARRFDCTLICSVADTISAVRNEGAGVAAAPVLVFIDSDIEITADWRLHIGEVVELLAKDPQRVTGSRVLAVQDGRYLNRYWFGRLGEYEARYINSGHLIVGRSFFESLNGFDENLKTAEDHDFCLRATEAGARVQVTPHLDVIHLDYPDTLSGFLKRERWHGRQDFQTWQSFRHSIMGQLAAFNAVLLLTCVVGSWVIGSLWILTAYPAIVGTMCIGFSLRRFGANQRELILGTASVFFFYLCGRSWALASRMLEFVTKRANEYRR